MRITDEEYDRYYQLFRSQIADIDGRLAMLQDAEDNYYITAKYVLELSNRAYDLFKNSEVEQKRQLMKLVLLNMVLDGKKVRFQVQKPFNTILNYSESKLMLPLINAFLDREIEFGFIFENIETVFNSQLLLNTTDI